MDNKREKLELVKNLNTFITKEWENPDDLLELFGRICGQYRELYVKPYFGIFSDYFAPMEVSSLESTTRAAFYEPCNIFQHDNVTVCGGNIIPHFLTQSNSNKKVMIYNKILDIMFYLATIGHEYEHNFQFTAQNIQDKIVQDKEKYHAKVDEISQKYAWELLENLNASMIDAWDVQSLLALDPAYREASPSQVEDFVFALYYKSFVEQDARAVEREIYASFIKDIYKLTKNKDIKEFVKNEMLKFDEVGCFRVDPDFYQNMWEINDNLQIITNIMSNIKDEDLIDFAKVLYETAYKDYREELKNYIENGTKMRENFIPQDKKAIILNALSLVTAKLSEDKAMITGYDEERKTRLKLMFRQFGVGPVDPLVTRSEYDAYFNLLKQGNITFNSFYDVAHLSSIANARLLSTYISRGQTEFCNGLIFSIVPNNNYIDHLAPLLNEIVVAAIDKRLKDLENTKTFDDIDDCITMLANFCDILGVPYYGESLTPERVIKESADQYSFTPKNNEVRKKIFELYQRAEKMGYDFVCTLLGHEPRPDQYRYAHSGDRAKYTLQGEQADERLKEIYGKIAYDDVMWHRQMENALTQEEFASTKTNG